jgi:hypothetical protein
MFLYSSTEIIKGGLMAQIIIISFQWFKYFHLFLPTTTRETAIMAEYRTKEIFGILIGLQKIWVDHVLFFIAMSPCQIVATLKKCTSENLASVSANTVSCYQI